MTAQRVCRLNSKIEAPKGRGKPGFSPRFPFFLFYYKDLRLFGARRSRERTGLRKEVKFAARRHALMEHLQAVVGSDHVASAGLAVLPKLPAGTSDLAVVREASAFGMSPSPLSIWYSSPAKAETGLLLSVATLPRHNLESSCDRLFDVVRRFGVAPLRPAAAH